MDWKSCLLPLAFPLSVLVIGSWHLVVSDRSPWLQPASVTSAQDSGPDYTQPPPDTHATCQQDPALGDALLMEGRRLGITVRRGEPELPGRDASYRAEPGAVGHDHAQATADEPRGALPVDQP